MKQTYIDIRRYVRNPCYGLKRVPLLNYRNKQEYHDLIFSINSQEQLTIHEASECSMNRLGEN